MDIKELLKIEEDGELLRYRVTYLDLPLWMFLRSEIIHFYIPQKLFGLDEGHIKINPFKLPFQKKFNYIAKSILKHPFRLVKKDIVIFGAGINNVLENNYYINRLYDPFWDYIKDKVLLLESSNKFFYPTPRFNYEVLYSDIIPILSKTLSKLLTIPKKDIDTINSFCNELISRVNHLFGIDIREYFQLNKKRIYNLIPKIKVRGFLFKNLLKLIKPKLIIIEDAHYGGYTDLIYLAKQYGIKVAEYQHGFIGRNHLAYNYSSSIHEIIATYLPDYMLFWGRYWSESTMIPAKKVIVGFPYLEQKTKDADKYKENIILLISSGTIPEEVVNFGLLLITFPEFKNYKFIFRPHPTERPAVNERYGKLISAGYELDLGNLYETLKKVEICIGLELSTVLYEAVAFNCKVFLKKTKASSIYGLENLPFNTFENLHDLKDQLLTSRNFGIKREYLFESGSISKFRDFLDQEIYL